MKTPKEKKTEPIPSKRAMNAFMKFLEVSENSKVILKTGAYYEKETLKYFRRLINVVLFIIIFRPLGGLNGIYHPFHGYMTLYLHLKSDIWNG